MRRSRKVAIKREQSNLFVLPSVRQFFRKPNVEQARLTLLRREKINGVNFNEIKIKNKK